jgi:hypothetical protein
VGSRKTCDYQQWGLFKVEVHGWRPRLYIGTSHIKSSQRLAKRRFCCRLFEMSSHGSRPNICIGTFCSNSLQTLFAQESSVCCAGCSRGVRPAGGQNPGLACGAQLAAQSLAAHQESGCVPITGPGIRSEQVSFLCDSQDLLCLLTPCCSRDKYWAIPRQ